MEYDSFINYLSLKIINDIYQDGIIDINKFKMEHELIQKRMIDYIFSIIYNDDIIEIDDMVRQADYKYTYSDSSNTVLKSEHADMLVQAVEKFAQYIPLNVEEIFTWYFEQKGVDNSERFLGTANGNQSADNNALLSQAIAEGKITPEILSKIILAKQILTGEANPEILSQQINTEQNKQ